MIVLDRHLPDGDGWEVARKLKALPSLKNVPILGFTSMGQRSEVENALVAGCDVFVEKPCAPETLVRYVRGMVGLDVEIPPSSRMRLPPSEESLVPTSAIEPIMPSAIVSLLSGTSRARPSR